MTFAFHNLMQMKGTIIVKKMYTTLTYSFHKHPYNIWKINVPNENLLWKLVFDLIDKYGTYHITKIFSASRL